MLPYFAVDVNLYHVVRIGFYRPSRSDVSYVRSPVSSGISSSLSSLMPQSAFSSSEQFSVFRSGYYAVSRPIGHTFRLALGGDVIISD